MAYLIVGECTPCAFDAVTAYKVRLKAALPLGWESMEKRSTFGLTPDQLGRLLAVGARTIESADAMVDDQANEKLLQVHLSRRLSEEPYSLKATLPGAQPPATEGEPLLDRSVKEILLDPQCGIAVLRTIKDCCKRLSAVVASGSETLITTTVYYAAIAAALVHHNQRISQYSYDTLAERFFLLAQRLWIDRELRRLFTQATEICRRTKTDIP